MAILFVFSLVLATSLAQIPIPQREVGFVYNSANPNAPVHFDFYIDQMCPYSKEAFGTVLQLASVYGPETLKLTIHLFPLPYHRNSFYASKGSHIFNKVMDTATTFNWMKTIYERMDMFSNNATVNIPDSQIVDMFANIADKVGVPASQFKALIMDENIEMDTRVGWKYCCTRGVAHTPTFMINDVVVAGEPTWTVSEWKQVIDPLLSGPPLVRPLETTNTTCPPGIKQCEFLPGKIECCKDGEFCIPNVGCRC
ncbi:uncharacterized protein [Haliotis asinina]|uniref:uncharacterized protein n=1 Tax=Haliotis asinina TaxID=109174 RepID=UPI00353261F5